MFRSNEVNVEVILPGEQKGLAEFQPLKDIYDPVDYFINGQDDKNHVVIRQKLRVAAYILTGSYNEYKIDWRTFTVVHYQFLKKKLLERNSAKGKPYERRTVNQILTLVRGVAERAFLLGIIPSEELMRIKAEKGVRYPTNLKGREIPSGEIEAYFESCDNDPGLAGKRDAAILCVALLSARKSEVCDLAVGDFQGDHYIIRESAKSKDKRICWTNPQFEERIEAWLDVRGRENSDAPMFCRVNKRGTGLMNPSKPLSGLYQVIKNRCEKAGINPPFTPHDCRRTFATVAQRQPDMTNTDIMRQGGWKSTVMLFLYDRTAIEETKEKIRRLNFC
jgi:integrase